MEAGLAERVQQLREQLAQRERETEIPETQPDGAHCRELYDAKEALQQAVASENYTAAHQCKVRINPPQQSLHTHSSQVRIKRLEMSMAIAREDYKTAHRLKVLLCCFALHAHAITDGAA